MSGQLSKAESKSKGTKPQADVANEPKPFLAKLYKMVDDAETDYIISWLQTGEGLIINEVESFVSQLLPQYFKHSNLSSFVRQLNTYGFSKVGPDAWVFAHPHFRRGDLDALNLIQRKSSHRPAGGGNATAAEAAIDDDAALGEGAGGPEDEEMKRELLQIRSQSGDMSKRIEELSAQIQASRAKQASTKGAIERIMTFLSQVYNHANLGNLAEGADPPVLSAAKRRRIEDHTSTTATAADDADSVPAPLFGSPGPALRRQPSLGQQAAMALPADLQEIALQLIDDTDLQDQCLKEVREGAPDVSRQMSAASRGSNEDLESFLWDFLETNQDNIHGGTVGGNSSVEAQSAAADASETDSSLPLPPLT